MMSIVAWIKAAIPRGKFARSVSILAGGAAAGQGIVVLSSPVLTRLYTPAEFGLLAVFGGLLGLLGIIASLRYELAVALPESDEEGFDVVLLCLLVLLGTVTITALSVLIFREQLSLALRVPELMGYLWFLPVGLLLLGSYGVFNYWGLRTRAYGAVARTRVFQSVSMVVVQLVGYPLGALAMILGLIAGQAVGVSRLAAPAFQSHRSRVGGLSWRKLRDTAFRYRRFPLYSTWGAVMNSASHQLPAILLAGLFSPVAAGVYFLAHRVIALPSSVVGTAVSQVFLSQAPDAARNGSLKKMVRDVHERLSQIMMPVVFLLMVAAPELFMLVFGEEWRLAGWFVQWMAPWVYFQFVASPLSLLFVIFERQHLEIYFQGALLVSRVGALTFGWFTGDLLLTIVYFSMASALNYLAILIWGIRVSGNEYMVIVSAVVRQSCVAMFLVLPLAIVSMLEVDRFFWFLGLAVTLGLCFFRYYKLGRAQILS